MKGLSAEDDTKVKESMDLADDIIAKISAAKKDMTVAEKDDDKDLPETRTGKMLHRQFYHNIINKVKVKSICDMS